MMENKTKIYLKNKSIFITGVAGFIGSNLAKRLLSTVEGVKVVGLDNMNNYYDVRLKEARLKELEQFEKFSFVKGNLADKAVIKSIFEQYKPEIVVNLGAQAGVRYSITNPDAYVEANLIGFYNILEACRHSYDEGHTPVEHLVYASSSSVYGSNKKVPYSTDDKVDNPVSLYAATKKSNELMAHAKATRYWKSDEFEDAKTNLEEKNRVYTAAKNELTQAQNDLMDAEDAVTNYKPSSGSLVMEMLVEFLKPNFNINDMNKHMEDLVDYVLSIGEGEQIPSNYAEIVETVLEINNVLDDYSRLKNADDSESAEEKIKQLKIDVEEKLTIPNPQEDDFENTKTMWVAEWKTRLENLREIVWRIPSYSGEEIAAFSASGIEINKDALEYDSTDISNKIDRLERNKLTDINVMEKVCLLISGKYPLTAIVALLIAIELDMISLLVGVVIYWMSKVSKGTDKEIVLT